MRHACGERGAALGRLGRAIDDASLDVDLPAMEDAAQPVRLVARQRQRGAAMRARLVEEPDPASPLRKATKFSPSRRTRFGVPTTSSLLIATGSQ